jgi:hypothetical protein
VNPQCPKADNCRKHIMNRTDPRTPSIAIITWYECDHYDAIDPEKYKEDTKRGVDAEKDGLTNLLNQARDTMNEVPDNDF